MAYGIKALRKLQFGKEVTAGTKVAATTIWRGEGTLEDNRTVVFPVEDVGMVSPTDRNYTPALHGKLTLVNTPATFEQILYILEAGVKAITSGVADGVGSGFLYNYTMPTTSQNTIKTLTVQGGDNQEAEVMEYCFVTDFELSGKAGEAVMMTANLEGRQIALQSFTGALSVPTVEEILCSKGKLYIDAVGGTLGSTQVTGEVLEFSYKVKTGLIAVFTADGSLYFTFAKGTRPEVTLELTLEHSTNASAQKVLWRAGTARQMRFIFEGSTLTTSSTYVYKTLRIDLAGKYESVSALDDQDGDNIVKFVFRGGYNSSAALFNNILVVNELSAVT